LEENVSFTEAVTIDRVAKCIHGGRHFIYVGGQDWPSRKIDLLMWSKNGCLLKSITEPPKIYIIFEGGPLHKPACVNIPEI
jgi:hypothetical protein